MYISSYSSIPVRLSVATPGPVPGTGYYNYGTGLVLLQPPVGDVVCDTWIRFMMRKICRDRKITVRQTHSEVSEKGSLSRRPSVTRVAFRPPLDV